MNSTPKFAIDKDLRDCPEDPDEVRALVFKLEAELEQTTVMDRRAAVLGEIGTYLRTLKELDLAERNLRESLAIVSAENLGLASEIQQKIRLAHVLQWKKYFAESTAMFAEVIATCRNNLSAQVYLDFALQHAGKNCFDQKLFEQALGYFEEALLLREVRHRSAELIESSRSAVLETKDRIGANRV